MKLKAILSVTVDCVCVRSGGMYRKLKDINKVSPLKSSVISNIRLYQ